jgi:hypothetical protein
LRWKTPAAAVGAEMAWTDIGDLEVLPVVEVDKIMPRITDKMMTAAAR